MKRLFKNNLLSMILLGATILLTGVGIFISIRLYQLRQQNVAPNAPGSTPAAASNQTISCQAVLFTVKAPTASPTATAASLAISTPSPTPTLTPTATPTPTNPPIGGVTTPTPTPTPVSTPVTTTTTTIAQASPVTTTPPIPVSGTETPTIIAIIGGVALLFVALKLVL
jgi:cytoskeletal protein RodZ